MVFKTQKRTLYWKLKRLYWKIKVWYFKPVECCDLCKQQDNCFYYVNKCIKAMNKKYKGKRFFFIEFL